MALLSLDEAQSWVITRCSRLAPANVLLRDALGRVLAEDVVSSERVPPFANTAMDGFAVRAADVATVPCDLVVVGTLAAGAEPSTAVGPGEAIRIMTGAAMPDGADSIVPIENTDPSAGNVDRVRILKAAAHGDAVRPAGEDVQPGQLVFGEGTVLDAGHVGVLASIGCQTVRVYGRPRVGVLSTGDELIEAPTPLRVGQIRDSNRHSLAALVRQAGCEAIDLGLARDTEADIEAHLRTGLETCDAIVTSGGVSVGDFDYVKVVLDRLSAGSVSPMRWMQIAIRPAKPLAFGVIGDVPVFGLPGNPVSSMVSFELFAGPALRRMLGHPPDRQKRSTIRAIADEDFNRRSDGKTYFDRVRASFEADGRLHVRSAGGQSSNLLRTLALADALVVLPDGPGARNGDEVDVLLLAQP